jgi:Ca2+-binding RTX toxin-like protein
VLAYAAGPGVANQLTAAYQANDTYTFQDAGEPIFLVGVPGFGSGTNSVVVGAGNVYSVRVDVGDANDSAQILATKTATPLLVYAGVGDDRVYVGNSSATLNGIQGAVSVRGLDGYDELHVNDYAAPLPSQTYEVTASKVTRGGIAGVNYDSGVEYVRLNAGTGDDVVNVRSTSAATTTAVSLKTADDDVVRVGSAAGSLDSIQGYLLIAGDPIYNGGPRDAVVVNDWADADANNYDVTANSGANGGTYTQVSRNGQLLLNGGTLESLTLNAGAGSDVINVKAALVPVTVNAGGGDDTVRMYPGAVFAPVWVNGQAGTDALDYSLHTTEVYVNLKIGWGATDLVGISGIENAIGGTGDDVLVGGDGANVLSGGSGHDVLIGGLGADILDGGVGDDLLIGGLTTHDTNKFALLAIGDEWASANPYAVRIDHLKNGGGLNSIFHLTDGQSVLDDGMADQLIGGIGQDWFWGDPAEVLDMEPGESVK